MTSAPHWRTDDLYSGFDDPRYLNDQAKLKEEVGQLERLFDELEIRGDGPVDGSVPTAASVEPILNAWNALSVQLNQLSAFIQAFTTVDSRHALAQQQLSALIALMPSLRTLRTRLLAWLGTLDEQAQTELLEQSALSREHQHFIRLSRRQAQHQMSPSEEALAARLSSSGAGGWEKLHGDFTSQLTGQYRDQLLTITELRNLASDPDPQVRREAFEAELAVWQKAEVVCAACLNGVKGEQGELSHRRGFAEPLDASLLENSIDRATLSAMQAAVVRSFPDFQRYFRAKARALGKTQLDWWDLTAPLGSSHTVWEYWEGAEFVEAQFRSYSARLGDFAARAFQEGWIDAEPRDGKRGGAFCMPWAGDACRILLNHAASLDSVCTLAHELGHGYHNLLEASRTPLQRETPMTLAETASIFCETIVQQAALTSTQGQEKLYVLETQLMGQAMVVVDIHSRFLFEQQVFERRAQRELTAQEFCELMTQAQRQAYGDTVDTLHPYMWAVKPHYYSSQFYNYPYTFGLLFGLGLYAQYQQARTTGQEADFQARYDDLLASTGLADAQALAQRFGIDLHQAAFWESSLGLIRAQIDQYEQLVATL